MSLPFISERTLAVSLEQFLKTVIKLTSHKINHSNKYKLVALGTFKCYTRMTSIYLQNNLSLLQKTPYLLNNHTPSFPPTNSHKTSVHFLSPIDLSILNTSYKQNQLICDLSFLDPFIQPNILRSTHTTTCISSFLWLNDIPLYGYSTFYSFIS